MERCPPSRLLVRSAPLEDRAAGEHSRGTAWLAETLRLQEQGASLP